ncbi:MAG: hypothetical protein ACTSXP_08165 [Promethearchaeota archaeon]
MGTYVYDHQRIANYPEYMDDLAKLVDRVLIDISWGAVMKNASQDLNLSNPVCIDLEQFQFYDKLFQNLTSRGLGIVIQFSPTRLGSNPNYSPRSWLNVSLEMDGYRAKNPPQNPQEREFFINQLLYYVNYTVEYFDDKPYFLELEYCLADEPHTADWHDVLHAMYTSIKARSNRTVSVVVHIPELYKEFSDSFDLFTIDPYNNDMEMYQKIKKAHEDVNFSKPVRVIISGMGGNNFDYQRVYRQLIISWFCSAYDIWFWSYNSRWLDNYYPPEKEWYVVKFSEDGPVYTARADAIVNARQDLKILAQIDNYIKTGNNDTKIKDLQIIEQEAYKLIMQNNFPAARRKLLVAQALINS